MGLECISQVATIVGTAVTIAGMGLSIAGLVVSIKTMKKAESIDKTISSKVNEAMTNRAFASKYNPILEGVTNCNDMIWKLDFEYDPEIAKIAVTKISELQSYVSEIETDDCVELKTAMESSIEILSNEDRCLSEFKELRLHLTTIITYLTKKGDRYGKN